MAALAKVVCETMVGKEVRAHRSKGVMAGPVPLTFRESTSIPPYR